MKIARLPGRCRPSVSASMTVTGRPWARSASAAVRPTGPAPTTTTLSVMSSDIVTASMPPPTDDLDLMRRGDGFFLEAVAALDDERLREPSLLPGWTRAHIVTHMARNADGLRNLLTWARTGVETPMYVGDQRERDIEAGVRRPIAEQR